MVVGVLLVCDIVTDEIRKVIKNLPQKANLKSQNYWFFDAGAWACHEKSRFEPNRGGAA